MSNKQVRKCLLKPSLAVKTRLFTFNASKTVLQYAKIVCVTLRTSKCHV